MKNGIIPRPEMELYSDGSANWVPGNGTATIAYSGDCSAIAVSIAAMLGKACGVPWTTKSGDSAFIRLRLEEPSDGASLAWGAEGYSLDVDAKGISCRAIGAAGLFYAIQSLRQLLPAGIESDGGLARGFSVPFVSIVDRPRFPWRGFMLDEARHFHGVETVKALLDLMALHKLNVFHWHFNDDQGWRIELDRYPELTRIGSRRRDTVVGGWGSVATAGVAYGGFYTKAQVRDIVDYAAGRFIAVVPEFELPGHASAVLASYPELGCSGGPYEVEIGPGIFKDIYCAGKDSTLNFMYGVIDELSDLFPSPYFHIGGDEAPTARWEACPSCQARLKAEGLAGMDELRTWLFNKVADYALSHGKMAIGWNEALGERFSPKYVAQFWMGSKRPLIDHIRRGGGAIMSDFWRAYLDYDYCLHPLRKSYGYEPIPRGLSGDEAARVLGLEAPLWTEWVSGRTRLDWQTFPRLSAHAETAWTPAARKSYPDFKRRLTSLLPRLNALGVRYAPKAEWDPPAMRRLVSNTRFFVGIASRKLAARKTPS